jgi:hypothetical protein
LDHRKEILFENVFYYKPPSKESKVSIDSGKVKVDGQEEKLDAKQISFTHELSKTLVCSVVFVGDDECR